MTPEKQERLQACLPELAALLYEETDKKKLSDLESIEKTIRSVMLGVCIATESAVRF